MIDPTPAKSANEPTGASLILPSTANVTPRRRFLATAGIVTGSLAMSVQNSNAFFFFGGSKADFNTDDLPQEWVQQQGKELQGYARHIAKHRLEKLTVQQVIKAHARQKGTVWNNIPPRSMWDSMIPTLQAADKVAVALGSDLKEVTSAYRCPAYNARCPGAKPRSYHQQNVALDLMFNTSQSRVARVARELRNNGLFKGGVGRYSLFTHIDTRGYNADW
ncbi:MAG: D-Ala-D-Ala carboxypeptidase family metallohydrolase [Roseibacillus sp.]